MSPQVGDIIRWTGFGGPQVVLIIRDCGFEIYKVLLLAGKRLDDDLWTLNEHNALSWKVLA